MKHFVYRLLGGPPDDRKTVRSEASSISLWSKGRALFSQVGLVRTAKISSCSDSTGMD